MKNILKILLTVVIFEVFIILCGKLNFIQDDAYISLQYAKNFVLGKGLVFNTGEHVEGFTSFLWVLFLAIPYLFHINPEVFAKVLSISFGVLCLILTYILSKTTIRKFDPHLPSNSYINFLPVILLMISGTFYYWSVSGMETTLYTFLILMGITFYLMRSKGSIFLHFSMVSLTLAFLTRQEAIIIIMIICLNLFLEKFRKIKLGMNYREIFSTELIIFLSIFIIPAIIFLFFRFSYYGYIFPNTFYAKTGSSFDYIKTGFQYTISFLIKYTLYGAILILPLILIKIRELKETVIIFYLMIISYIVYVILVGGDVLAMHRFFIPILPLVYILFSAFALYVYKLTQNFLKNNFLRSIIFVLITFFVGMNIYMNTNNDSIQMSRREKGLVSSMKSIGLAIKKVKEKQDKQLLIAASTIGALKYFSDCKILDMLGLTNKFIAHNPAPLKLISDYNTGWKEKNYNAKYVLSKKPDYIIFSTKEKPSSFAERALFTQGNFLKDYFVYPIFIDSTEEPINVYKRRSKDNILSRSGLVQRNKDYSPSFVNLYNFFLNQINNRIYIEHFDKAKKTFNDLIKICPSHFAEPYRFMALIYYYKGNYKNAEAYSNKCISLDPSNIYARIILYRIGKIKRLKNITRQQEDYFKNNFPELYSKSKFINDVDL